MAQLSNNQPRPNSQPPSMATPEAQPLLDPSLVSPSEISVLQTPDSSDITVVQRQQPTQPTITVLARLQGQQPHEQPIGQIGIEDLHVFFYHLQLSSLRIVPTIGNNNARSKSRNPRPF
ncbi:hypothetical protein PGTUg99_033055 [Puccinia graminis f. sp. tritici]|uniref:Uncharacterized protein n=1 Tax=Puccinia graminis f. sp. tritici TaxID=56615 RepID=A0A5B0R992_PUCGR|nr:hypothetical protein PGTUg99_033055 [Puccinia graminis f. sp. tritici]